MLFRYQTEITSFTFDYACSEKIKKQPFGIKWPVVYIIKNHNSIYIGETSNITIRILCHLKSEEKKTLDRIYIIHNKAFNKSAVLDIENFLITHISADGKYYLLNGNGGQFPHNYYKCELYRKEFQPIWLLLKEQGLVQNDIQDIRNSEYFKFSPFKTLTTDQYSIVTEIIQNLKTDIENDGPSRSIVINGGSGTGKSVLGVFLLKLLRGVKQRRTIIDAIHELPEENLSNMVNLLPGNLKIGYVVPTVNFRITLIKIFKSLTRKRIENYINQEAFQILSPNEVAKSDTVYDLLIVDESHRLRRRKALAHGEIYRQFDINNKNLGLEQNEGTELDWILKKSRCQIFFYDAGQSIKPSDVPKERFDNLMNSPFTYRYELKSQLRCLGGNDYIQYLEDILNCTVSERRFFKGYAFKLYGNVNDMVEKIKELDKKYGLCRNVAGFAWDWNTKSTKENKNKRKGKTAQELLEEDRYDIKIGDYKYIWNIKSEDWINSPDSVNQIGCIHTIQGYDLNYAGVILGTEIDYDNKEQKIVIYPDQYKDTKGKMNISYDELLEYIKNIYRTNLARGIHGTFVYACNKGLKRYLKNYISFIPHDKKIF